MRSDPTSSGRLATSLSNAATVRLLEPDLVCLRLVAPARCAALFWLPRTAKVVSADSRALEAVSTALPTSTDALMQCRPMAWLQSFRTMHEWW